ncbi:hypothetical protein MPEAHAMD_6993 [Methylobacterium frigidaeris]|uniref:Uncharacterized protein n=2 Tax=Methylobacterium frigidaeris TaxID=2038277 RepID=A0AA37HJ67_9HYPH|nr:hypothetical protein MPEAHAMD_6993 [Methylobacterium frigidaeris]
MVRLHAEGGLVVSSLGTPPHRIVATRAKWAWVAGQRVAELIEEALAALKRSRSG